MTEVGVTTSSTVLVVRFFRLHLVCTTTFVTLISPKVKSRFEDKELNYSLVYVGSHGSNDFSLHGGPK